MESIVKVTRRGQTTIPAKFRAELGIKEGDQLFVKIMDKGILFRAIPKLEDMAGIDSAFGTPDEMKKKLDKLREEY